jgi:hypothetical protein
MRTYPDLPTLKGELTVSGNRHDPSFWTEDIAGLLNALRAFNHLDAPGVFRLIQTSAKGSISAVLEVYLLNRTLAEDLTRMMGPILGTSRRKYNISPITVGKISSFANPNEPTITEFFGSTILSRNFFESPNGPLVMAKRMAAINLDPGDGLLTSNLGGRINNENSDLPLHPAWRSSAHLVSLVVNVDTSLRARERAMVRLTDELMPMLYAIDSSQWVSYSNMGNPNEPDFKERYWGMRNYRRLVSIKKKWDPKDLFIARVGVRSDGWDSEGMCRT